MSKSPGKAASLAAIDALAPRRIAIEGVRPSVDAGRFSAKAVAGWPLIIEADAFGDGHDTIRVAVLHWPAGGGAETEVAMAPLGNDRWRAEVMFDAPGPQVFTIIAWRDLFATWAADTAKKIAAGQDVALEAQEGRDIVAAATEHAPPRKGQRTRLKALLKTLDRQDAAGRIDMLMADATADIMQASRYRANPTRFERDLPIWVDRERAAFGAWYEIFPRSWGKDGAHGTFDDVIGLLPRIRDLGYDVLYFPPIHPIGRINRKGRNNALTAGPDEPGSPYAIGSAEGGHRAIHPELGTFEDFRRLVAEAGAHGLEIALDFAIQCAPDHPWIREHPEWFDWRPDGTIKYAENPPKKYQDIVNVHFYRQAIPSLWLELRDVVLFWVEQGVRIFRVDNPHTKPFPFWEWLIAEVQARDPGVIFLSEAFTRPKVMKRLAKVGFTQSYSYFTWRDDKAGLTEYLTELTGEAAAYMRPNFFANTPDINPVFLQTSGRPGFRIRAALAATLVGNYGIYSGFEICEAAPVPGKEEYLDSEKYQLRAWDMDRAGHINDDIRLLNSIRHAHTAMRDFTNLRFYAAHDDAVLYYGRMDARSDSYLLFHVLLDPQAPHDFAFEVPLWEFGLPDDASIEVEDLAHGNRFTWHGKHHRLTLDPATRPWAAWRLFPPGSARSTPPPQPEEGHPA